MIVFNGPAATGWERMGQAPAAVMPSDVNTKETPQNAASGAAKAAEAMAYILGGGFLVYALLNLLGAVPGERRPF